MQRKIECYNKGLFTSMTQFELKQRSNGKTSLGTGSFGTVNLVQHVKSQSLYAIKSIQQSNIQTPYEQEGVEREIKVHLKCHHPNIVNLYDSFIEHGNVYMVLEYAENGNLYNYVQRRKRLDEKEACKYFIQTCKALQYLHEINVFHRDIKPENLLLDSNNDIKLCDFGWCAENIHLKRKTFCGTYEYMAPEIVSDLPYDYKIDIWSVGVLLYELLHGYAPFKGKEYKEIAANIKTGLIRYSSSINADAQELIKNILQKEPSQRLSFKDIYQSPFVQRCYPQQGCNIISLSPRSSFSVDQNSIQKYQSPLISHKQQPIGRLNQTNGNNLNNSSSLSIKSPNISKTRVDSKKQSNIFDDIKKKIIYEQTSPLRDATNMHKRNQASLTNLIKNSNTKITQIKSPQPKKIQLSKYCSKSRNFDENGTLKLLDQFKSMPSFTIEDQQHTFEEENRLNLKTDRVIKVQNKDCVSRFKKESHQSQDLDKILKMYLSMCSSRQ
ncbi:unnamed protein product (macronuclear) [Paramecium tetraurelia]|uniref:Aurora kinase n=1 Tax=Paramecium tetraurelia TaxID=5888 RepID=A0CJ09_PARTE|nr:uncharacterized protein GSPATT00007911001 [Paramecium tetraurelia]CAK70776.1 unnamed protein product [Paramecium tetraurelia]|eukprot:XP_001438173.1 hypothetical protein (macronuclear) [Paramecium tetraurelia strain d4-2]